MKTAMRSAELTTTAHSANELADYNGRRQGEDSFISKSKAPESAFLGGFLFLFGIEMFNEFQ